jgi:hypothetical protein
MDRKGPGKGMRYDAEWLLEKSRVLEPTNIYAQKICYPSPSPILSVNFLALCRLILVSMRRLYTQSNVSYRIYIWISGEDLFFGMRCP